jgi:hypothetical protein
MPVPDAIVALARQWEQTVEHLSDEDLHIIEEEAAQRAGDTRSASRRIVDVLVASLPRHHPVRRAATGGRRLAGPGDRWTEVTERLAAIASFAAAARADREADAWLLETPTVPWAQVRDRADDLIRLTTPSGDGDGPGDDDERAPAFQFDADGHPRPVVLEVNRLLDVQDDPWGVADWWLGGNAWLAGVPADLVGEIDDDLLVRAARAELVVE